MTAPGNEDESRQAAEEAVTSQPLSGTSGLGENSTPAAATPESGRLHGGAGRFSLNDFHLANIARQHEAFAPAHSLMALAVCAQEEVGELAAAILGVTGEKKRKAHLTNDDVLDAVADAITYLSLVAGAVGCTDLETLMAKTFNMVSRRVGSAIFVNGDADPLTVPMLLVPSELVGRLEQHLETYLESCDGQMGPPPSEILARRLLADLRLQAKEAPNG